MLWQALPKQVAFCGGLQQAWRSKSLRYALRANLPQNQPENKQADILQKQRKNNATVPKTGRRLNITKKMGYPTGSDPLYTIYNFIWL